MNKYEFIYSKKGDSWEFDNFVRQIDTPIFEQKRKISKLLEQNIHNELIEMVKEDIIPISSKIVVFFETDGLKLFNIKLGYYSQLEHN